MIDAREQVVRFLTSLAQASAALTLYERSHPALERAIEIAHEHLLALQEAEPRPVLTFLGEEVVFGSLPIKSLSSWEWGRRLAEIGVQRFECHGPVTRDDFDRFVSRLFDRITGTEAGPVVPDETSSIRFGLVGLGSSDASLSQIGAAVQGYALSEEIAALKWVDDEVRAGGKLHMAEVHTVVRSLAVAMHADVEMMIPLVELKGYDQYTTTHSMNISVLSMALGEFIGLSSSDVRRLGVAGLLHDIGKTKVSAELLNKSGKLLPEERAEIQRHPVEGAKILLQRMANLDLAAMVAYEHHIRFDGGGYPLRKYKRPCHSASDLVHLCDVYDALRTHRPYRKAWGQERVLDYIEESLGSEFDPELGQGFLEMMRRWGSRLHRITSKEDAVPIGQPDRPIDPEDRVIEVDSLALEETVAEKSATTAPKKRVARPPQAKVKVPPPKAPRRPKNAPKSTSATKSSPPKPDAVKKPRSAAAPTAQPQKSTTVPSGQSGPKSSRAARRRKARKLAKQAKRNGKRKGRHTPPTDREPVESPASDEDELCLDEMAALATEIASAEPTRKARRVSQTTGDSG